MTLALTLADLLAASAVAALTLTLLTILLTATTHDRHEPEDCRRCAALDRLISRVRGY
ncbi:hypothetical protein [Streptomyces chumphonensis]|uniref:hypothetical protein n=1 Tax=Streptomyces chumphonensis TaxID=1214925 RepID=UPI003D706418